MPNVLAHTVRQSVISGADRRRDRNVSRGIPLGEFFDEEIAPRKNSFAPVRKAHFTKRGSVFIPEKGASFVCF